MEKKLSQNRAKLEKPSQTGKTEPKRKKPSQNRENRTEPKPEKSSQTGLNQFFP